MKWIRWSGLAGFIVVVALIITLWLFALGPLMKMAIEKYGSEAVGAQVNVEDISLGFNPLSLTITGVQVADKDAPMENVVSFDTAVATLETFPLLLGHVIIPDVTLSGVAMGTARAYSGELDVVEEKETAESTTDQDAEITVSEAENQDDSESQVLPSADDILEREKLLTSIYGEELEESYKLHKTNIDKAVANIPTEQALKNYETELNRILTGKFKSLDDFKQRKKEFDALNTKFKKDKQAVAEITLAINEGKSDLSQKWSKLKGAPKQDFNNLKGKYTLDGAGVGNLTALLFGDEMGDYAATALDYYEKVRPLLVDDEGKDEIQAIKDQRLDGRFVQFDTDRPLPDFWIKTLTFTLTLPEVPKGSGSMGDIAINVQDITHQQDVINAPMRLWGTGQNLKDIKSLELTGVLDHRASPSKDVFNLDIQAWQLNNLKLGLVGLKLLNSTTSVKANATFSNGQMDVVGNGLFEQAKFDSKDRTFVAKEMVAALKNIDKFTVSGSAKGELTSPSVSLKSDLDKQLNTAFNKRIKQRQAELEVELKQKLNDKLLAYGGDYTEQLKELNLTEGSLKEKGKALEKLGKTELASYEAQLKAEADAEKARAKAKLDAKKAEEKAKIDAEKARAKAKLEAEKARAKAKAKAEEDKKKKELEEKAKAKLKKLFG
jgi:uncharacterized protein (TIGR03545 family)